MVGERAPWHIIRDAVLRTAPQDEVAGFVDKQEISS
jgi:hypothetical protein